MPNFEILEGPTAPNFPGVMLAIVIALRELGGERTNAEIATKIIANEEITPEAQSYLMPDGKTNKLTYYLRWSRSYLKYDGILENPAYGVWALTNTEQEITELAQTTEAHNRYSQRNTQAQDEATAGELALEEEINPDDAVWKNPLLDILKAMEYDAFERLCHNLLKKTGFIAVDVNLKKGADGGVDGVGIWRDNLLSRKIYFQCKCWRNDVGSPHIRNFRGALDGRVNQGLFFATSRFTKPAKDEAIRDGAILIDLIDGDRLCDLLKKNNLGFQENNAEALNPDYFSSV